MKKIIQKIALLICVSILYTSCDSIDYGTMNDNPNGPTTGVPSQLLTEAQIPIGDDIITSLKGILFTQQLTQGQYPGDSRYANLTSNYNFWYTGPIQNLNEIIKINNNPDLMSAAAAFGDNNNQIAVARIIRSFYLQNITDRWGALPWTEAFQGIDFPQPAFDGQQSLYTYIFDEIDAALAQINTSNTGPVGDVIFGGNMARWIVFANTLKMTMALRISDADASLAQSKFEQAVADGVVRSNSENILFNFGSNAESENPWYRAFYSRIDYLLSETLAATLRDNLDPRLFKFAEPSIDGTTTPNFPGDIDAAYVGAPNGAVNGGVYNYSLPTESIRTSQAYKSPIYTSSQVKFALAEAKLKGWNVGAGTTQSFFQEGIEDSMEFWGVAPGDIAAYTAAHTSATLADIAYEKWVSLYLNGPEAWAEWRRLDMPVLTPSAYADGLEIPVRDAYDASVKDNNPENYAAIVAAQGPDTRYTRLWWDVR
jgi:hypothetical protein